MKAHRFFIHLLVIISAYMQPLHAQTQPHPLYLIPGQGADARSFAYLQWEPHLRPIPLTYLPIDSGETIQHYAHRMAAQIDTTQPFSLVGVSFGGMIAVEMAKFLHPVRLIIVASAKNGNELAPRYRMMRYLPLQKIIPDRAIRWLSPMGRRLFEPDTRPHEAVYHAMIQDKPQDFLPRAIHAMVHWHSDTPPRADLVQIHGGRDKTLPLRHIQQPTYVLPQASHVMIMAQADALSEILRKELAPEKLR